jgi:hypothetical protein
LDLSSYGYPSGIQSVNFLALQIFGTKKETHVEDQGEGGRDENGDGLKTEKPHNAIF